ncbi:MAG: hypothetical protein LBN92_05795 [Treponema sp.]|jgi:hypothetical protein|nr:hypothetical protein [Treponema sp.]
MKVPILLLLVLTRVVSAQTAFPSLDADPRAADFARGVSSGTRAAWQDLARAALWASSVNSGAAQEERAAEFYERVSAAAAELAALDLPSDPRERGEYVLIFIHRRFLKGYSEYQTRLDEIFVSGRYNCVSSAVLYLVLGMSAGLDIGGVMTKDHAFASVRAGGAFIDVETTNPYGFDPGNRKEFHDGFGRTTGYAYVPARNYRDRAAINAVELVSLILSNRIAVLERANRYAEAVPLAINRAALLQLDSFTGADAVPADADRASFFGDPRKDMMSRLFNYGAYLVRTNRDDEAIAWAEYAGARYADNGRWQELVYAAANNKLVRLVRTRKTSEARAALETLRPKLSGANYRACDSMVLEAETADMVNGIKNPGDSRKVLAFIEANGERLPEKLRTDFRNGAVLREGERLGTAGDWRGAMNWMSASIERYGANSLFTSHLRLFRQNVISGLHNQFADLFNRRDYAGAKAAIQKSLEEFPADPQLTRDLNMVNRVLEQNR